MCTRILSQALPLSDEKLISRLEQIQGDLEKVPGTFHALFWLYTYNFLYISPGIEKVLGHAYHKYEKHGMVFFQSIIPADLIDHIYRSMLEQTAVIEKHPDYLLAPEILEVEAAVLDSEQQLVPVKYNAVLLDSKVFDPPSYLVFCSWIDISGKNRDLVHNTEAYIRELLLEIKKVYLSGRPDLRQLLFSRRNITEREKEVAYLLSRGYNTKSIGEQLHISFNTVESHRKNLLQKLQAKNTAELVFKISNLLHPQA